MRTLGECRSIPDKRLYGNDYISRHIASRCFRKVSSGPRNINLGAAPATVASLVAKPLLLGLCLGERAGPSVFHELWSHVSVYHSIWSYNHFFFIPDRLGIPDSADIHMQHAQPEAQHSLRLLTCIAQFTRKRSSKAVYNLPPPSILENLHIQ